MSFYRGVKIVDFSAIPSDNSRPLHRPDIDDYEDYEDDLRRSYDVYVDHRHYADLAGSVHEGDLYVRITSDAPDHEVHLYTESGWIAWDPPHPQKMTLVDIDAYPIPCDVQGLRYVKTEDAGDVQVSQDILITVSTLAELIAQDVGYPMAPKASRRTARGATARTTQKKRSRTISKANPPSSNASVDTSTVTTSRKRPKTDSEPNGSPSDITMGLETELLRTLCFPSPQIPVDVEDANDIIKEEESTGDAIISTVQTNEDAMDVVVDDRSPQSMEGGSGTTVKDYYRLIRDCNIPEKRSRRLSWPAIQAATYRPTTCVKDIEATIFMASASPADQVVCGTQPMLQVIHYTVGSETREQIRDLLSKGIAVLVTGWKQQEQLSEFLTESIQYLRPPLHQPVTWQDAHARAKVLKRPVADREYSSYITTGDLFDFAIAADEAKGRVWNCLDLPSFVPEIPAFVRGVMDDVNAFTATSMESYKSFGPSSARKAGLVSRGPQHIHVDNWRTVGWDVMTHAGFLTYPHHDAGGQGTYSFVRKGAKIWCYLQLDGVDESDQAAVLKGWTEYYSCPMAVETYDIGVRPGTLLLDEHDAVLIQPPGMNHMVYTPNHTIMSGGHFYSYDTMHLTEFALVFDLGLDQHCVERPQGTNAIHPGMLRKLYRMAIALPYFAPTRKFYRRCLIGLRSLIGAVSQDMLEDGENVEKLRPTETIAKELSAERIRALEIMDNVMKVLGVVDAFAEMRRGSWRDRGPQVDISTVLLQ